MNRIIKSILGIAAITFLAASCDVSQIGTKYSPAKDNKNVTFAQSVAVDTEIPATQPNFDIDITRSTADAAITVALNAEGFPEGVVVPTSVSFAAGEYFASIPVDVSELAIGVQAKGTISIVSESDFVDDLAISSISVTLKKAYIWESLGKGQWFDNLALMTDTSYGIVDVEILKADGFDRYRIMDPYPVAGLEAAGWEPGGEKSPYIEFWVAENGENIVWGGWWKPGILYDGDGTDIKAYLPSDLSASAAADDAKSGIVEENAIYVFYPYWYIDGLGGFGTKYPCFLAFPGIDLEAWLDE